MTGDELITEMVSIVETTCYPHFDRDYGTQEPITQHQWDVVTEKVLKLREKHKLREVANDGTSLREA